MLYFITGKHILVFFSLGYCSLFPVFSSFLFYLFSPSFPFIIFFFFANHYSSTEFYYNRAGLNWFLSCCLVSFTFTLRLGMQQMLPVGAKNPIYELDKNCHVFFFCAFLGMERIMQIDEKNRRQWDSAMCELRTVLFFKSLLVSIFITTVSPWRFYWIFM